MNFRNWIASAYLCRFQVMRSASLALVVFITVSLFVNFLLNGIFDSRFWPLFGLSLATLALGSVIVKYGFSKAHHKRQLVLVAVVVSVGAIAAASLFFTRGIQQALNYANFYLIRDPYLQQVNMVKRSDEPRFVAFKWDSAIQQALIFDESDELDEPLRIKPADWWRCAKQAQYELAVCDWTRMKVAEHFYSVSFFCESPYSGTPIPPD
jgi:hypothetical protein